MHIVHDVHAELPWVKAVLLTASLSPKLVFEFGSHAVRHDVRIDPEWSLDRWLDGCAEELELASSHLGREKCDWSRDSEKWKTLQDNSGEPKKPM